MSKSQLPVFATMKVMSNQQVTDDIFCLEFTTSNAKQPPLSGQFYLLRAVPSNTILGRPISLFYYDAPLSSTHYFGFLIANRGKGTAELCQAYGEVELLGPLGNGYPQPAPTDNVCLVGGGTGIASIASLCAGLGNSQPFDAYLCYKDLNHYFGIHVYDNIPISKFHDLLKNHQFHIASEDGNIGKRGTLKAILTANILRQQHYDVVYACGPTGMLRYVQQICAEAQVKCYLSLESRMACGVGACLGCTISTTEGNKRCCKDGPVFDGSIVQFPEEQPITPPANLSTQPDLRVTIAGVQFKNPIIAASGTFGYGTEYQGLADIGLLGGICSKGLTMEPRSGNSGVRLHETPSGLMNSIGLENPGIHHFIEHQLPEMLKLPPVTIANLSGSTAEDYIAGAKLLDRTAVPMIELNISCPNVKAGGMAFGMAADAAAHITAIVRAVTSKPLIVKLTPNAPYLVDVALAVRTAGADAISLVNTFQALAIDVETGAPVFNNVYAGLSGPAIKPLALRMVHEVATAIRALPAYQQIPIIGLGGITTWQDAVEFLLAGATAIQIGTATFTNPKSMTKILDGLSRYMQRKGFPDLPTLHASAQL